MSRLAFSASLLASLYLFTSLSSCGLTKSSGNAGGRGRPGTGSSSSPAGYGVAPNLSNGGASAADLEKLSTEELEALEMRRRHQNANETEALDTLELVNYDLCQTLNKIRRDCPTVRPLIPDNSANLLRCVSKTEQTNPAASDAALTAGLIKVTIPANKTGRFKFVVNDIYESTEFKEGTTEISFKALGASSVNPPRFIEIYKLVLQPVTPGTPLPPLAGFTVKVDIDGRQLFNEQLTEDRQTSSKPEYFVNLNALLRTALSDTCRMDQIKFNALVAKSEAVIQSQHVDSREAEYFANQAKAEKTTKTADTPAARQALIEKILGFQKLIGERSLVLEDELNKKLTFRKLLLTDSERGCHFNKAITSFEIEVTGGVERVPLGFESSPRPPMQSTGLSSELSFNFGGISFTVEGVKIFGGKYVYTKLKPTDVIGAFDQLVIRKKGVSFDPVRECKQKIPMPPKFESEECGYNIYEENVFTISEIIVRANEQVLYHGRDLPFKFDRNKQVHAAESVQNTPEWIKLMTDKNCDDAE